MRNVMIFLVIAGIIGVGVYKWDAKRQEEQAKRFEEYRRRQDEEQRRKEAENTETTAKSKALAILRSFMDQEVKKLNDVIEESKIELELIDEDQKSLSATIRELDAENDRKAEEARKRNKQYTDKVHRVLAILDSEKLNQLAEKYIGEDFSAMKAEYKSRMQTIFKMHRETTERLKANRDKYNKSVAGIDAEVDKKNIKAGKQTRSANAALEIRLDNLYKERNRLNSRIHNLKKGMSSPASRKRVTELETELVKTNIEIGKAAEIVNMSRANLAHLDATKAETSARRKYDTAITARQDEDNDVHKEMAHQRNIFNMAVEYENRSLDRIRNSMKSQNDILVVRIRDAEKKLEYIADATRGMDFMSSKDLEKVRDNIAKKLVLKIGDVTE